MILPAVNFHITRACDARCRFCFATFRDVPGQLGLDDACRLVHMLAVAGVDKLNFAGGEPTLHPGLPTLLGESRRAGLVTSVVTNGARLTALLDSHPGLLDWVGLSADSAIEATQAALGRGRGGHVANVIRLADRCRGDGVRVKLNTVVTALNVDEDMAGLVRRVAPERWKVFQVLPVGGQNDGAVERLLVSAAAFEGFVARHRSLAAEGLAPVVEDNDAMRGSYAMIDPLGRFFGNARGCHTYSRPILEVGVKEALAEVGVSVDKFLHRGGVYSWRG